MVNNPYPFSTNFQAKRAVVGACHRTSGNVACTVSVLDPRPMKQTSDSTPLIYVSDIQVINSYAYCYLATIANAFPGYYHGNVLVITDTNGYTYTWESLYSSNEMLYMYLNNTPYDSSTNPNGCNTSNPNGCTILTECTDSSGNPYYTLNSGTYTFSLSNYTTKPSTFTFSTPDTTVTPPTQTITPGS